jgi:hypothetical protein
MRPRRPHRQHSTGWWAPSSVISSPDNHDELSVMRGPGDLSEELTHATGTPEAAYATAVPTARAVHLSFGQRGTHQPPDRLRGERS